MSFRKTLLAATLLSLPMAANAQSWDPRVQGVYVGAGIGANYLMGFSNGLDGSGASVDAGFNWGWAGVLSVGYGFGNGLRLELEGNYRENGVDNIKVTGIGRLPGASGTARSYGVMFNALYDFRLGPVLPYVGAGIGVAWQDIDTTLFRVSAGNTALAANLSGTEAQFAYQAIIGIAFPIDAVPGLALTAEGRYFGSSGSDIDGRANVTATINGQTVSVGDRLSFSTENNNWSIMFGVRYNFGRSAAPAPVAAAAPAPARTFLVFFDWNSAELTARARQIIAEAVQARTRQQVTRIEVNGHTDTSGSPTYNQGLSERRAAAVAAELVRLGVPRNEIVTRGFGESQLLVPTPDNTREPQNRRVEIILR